MKIRLFFYLSVLPLICIAQNTTTELKRSVLTIGTYDRSDCGILGRKTRVVNDDREAAEAVMDKTGVSEMGTGFLYDYNGTIYVITCEHVLYKAGKVVGFDSQYNKYELEHIGSDLQYDIGVLRFKDKKAVQRFEGLELQNDMSNSEGIVLTHIGFWKIDGLPNIKRGHTITKSNRDFQNDHIRGLGYLESSAYVAAGFSGGPVLTEQGKVVGMNTSRNKKGTSYALSANILKRLIDDIIDDRKVTRAFCGIEFAQTSNGKNVYINGIIEDSPAADQFKYLIDKEVVSINSHVVTNIYDVLRYMEEAKPAVTVSLGLANKTVIYIEPDTLDEKNLVKIAYHTFDQYCTSEMLYSKESDSHLVVEVNEKKFSIKTAGLSGNKVFCLRNLAQLGVIIRMYSLHGHIELGKDDSHIYVEEIIFSHDMNKRILFY